MSLVMNWYWLTIAMSICFAICIVLTIIQRNAFRWYATTKQDNTIYKHKAEHLCLYGAYITASICSLQCLTNHISHYFPEWYCVYGMSICVIFHEAAKTFGYGFFLQRAKATIISTKSGILPPIMTNYILPVYISLYFITYSILCPLTFRGLSVNPHLTSIPTACLFYRYNSWIFYLSVLVEVINSTFFVFVFVQPLCKIIDSEQTGVINIIKFNVIFSSISCLSSVSFLLYRAASRHTKLLYYLWLAGNIDLVINALCIFVMVTANRMYVDHLFQKHCRRREDNHTHHRIVVTKNKFTKNEASSKHITVEEKSLIEMDALRLGNQGNQPDGTLTQSIKKPHFISETMQNRTMTFTVNQLKPNGVNDSKTSGSISTIMVRPTLESRRSVSTLYSTTTGI